VSHCANCGHALGLKQPIWWWNRTFCCRACKTLYKARWWRDFKRLSRIRSLPESTLRRWFMRVSLGVSLIAFIAIGGTVLLDQWITGNASAGFMLGTALLVAGVCMGLFATIVLLGLMISSALKDKPGGRDRPIYRTRREAIPHR